MNAVDQIEVSQNSAFARESLILWNVARDLLGLPTTIPVDTCFDTHLDWNLLVKRAFRNRLSAALITFCSKHNVVIPGQLREVLRLRRRDEIFRSQLYRQEFKKIITALQCVSYDIIPFKGLVIAENLYPQMRFRAFTDLDILVRSEKIAAFVSRLDALGYIPEPYLTPRQIRFEYEHAACVSFKHKQSPLQIDLHTHVTSPLLLSRRFSQEVIENAIEIDLLNTQVKVLSERDTLLVLALHGDKHHWQRLSWIVDLALALRKTNQEVIHSSLKRARFYQMEEVLQLGIMLVEALLNQKVVELTGIAASQLARLNSRKQAILGEFFDPAGARVFPTYLTGITLERPTALRRIKYLATRTFVPSINDFRTMKIPDSLFLLYFPLRIVRLTTRYLRRTIVLNFAKGRS